ncbi:cytochrome P450 [Kalaharituber pfeilii]|nr:cytochrome P450 [Kalaharituber pfeilii]
MHVFIETIRPYGDNVVTATEQKWPRQRKLVSGIFNEKNHRVVWRAAISQAMQMLNEWTALSSSTEKRSSGHVITEMQRDVRKTALHVISDAGFGVTLPFSPKGVARDDSYDHMTSAEELSLEEEFSDVKPAPGCDLVYRESLAYMSVEYIRAFVTVLLFPKFLKPFATKTIKHTLNAHRDCGYYLQALIKRARMAKQRGEIEGKENLLASLVTQQEEIKKMLQAEKTEGKAKTMEEITEADVMGNTFIIAIAGHETTAGTLAFAFALLAMNQDKQDWVLKNLDEALEGESEDPMNWDYNVVFPKLISPMALMYETLRLYSPVLAIPKSPIGTAYVHYRGKRCLVPPNTIVELDVPALQYQHKMWGPNSYSFQPEIWDGRRPADPAIEAFSNSVCGGRGHMFPNVHTPQKGSFIPFSDGNRACIGQKFSQVEFAAVMAVVLRKWRVELVMNDSESREEAVKRVQRILDGSTVKLTLMMKEKLEIRLVPR